MSRKSHWKSRQTICYRMFASKDRGKFAEGLAIPLAETEVSKRRQIKGNIDDEIEEGLVEALKEIAEGEQVDND